MIRAKLRANIVGANHEIKVGEIVEGEMARRMLLAGMADLVKDEGEFERAILTKPRRVKA